MIAIITDTHFGARNDSAPMQQNQEKFLERVFFPTLKKYDIREVLHGGDYTDRRKYVSFGTAQWMYKHYRQPLHDAGIHEIALVGNHDCFLKHSTSINSIEELYRGSTSLDIITQPDTIELDGQDILMLPWICDDNRDASMRAIEDSNATIVLGHLEVMGFQMYRGMPNAEGLNPNLFERFPLVMSGHFHHRSEVAPIQYLGAAWPMTWSDYDDPRGFHVFDPKTRALTFIDNPYSLFTRLVYDDKEQTHDYIAELCQRIGAAESPFRDAYVKVVVKAKLQPHWFDLMIDALYKVTPNIMILDDILLSESDNDVVYDEAALVDTVTLINEYVESLTLNCPKDALNRYLRDLYAEAVAAQTDGELS